MPTWTAENDLKLATAIIALHQIKVSKDDCERLAAIVGDGCTAKAIIHRVAKFREAASKLDLQDGTAVPATPPTVKKRARKTKADEDQDGDGASATPTKKARTPKTKKAATTGKDDVEEEKTFKVEAADEEETMAAA